MQQKSRSSSSSKLLLILNLILALSCITVVMVGVSGLSSCAHTPAEVQQQLGWCSKASNTLGVIGNVAKVIPEPVGSGLTLLVTASMAALTAWVSHLHRSMVVLKNGQTPAKETEPAK